MKEYLDSWKKGLSFNGRARRKEYWKALLVDSLIRVFLVIIYILSLLHMGMYVTNCVCIIYVLYSLAYIIPSISITIRRLHDTDKSGLFYLVGLIPYIGLIPLIVLLCQDSVPCANKYGRSPKYNNEI